MHLCCRILYHNARGVYVVKGKISSNIYFIMENTIHGKEDIDNYDVRQEKRTHNIYMNELCM